MILKMRVDSVNGEHVKETLFAGNIEGSLANIGTLTMSIGEYQLIGAALLLGAERTQGRLRVINEDKLFRDWSDKEEV